MSATRPGETIGPETLDHAASRLLSGTDPVLGGMRGAPKFPNPPNFRFLWQNGVRSGRQDEAAAVHLLLRRMSQGGI